MQRLSGPLLDRVDVQIEVPAVTRADLALDRPPESTTEVGARVARARAAQRERLRPLGLTCNADLSGQVLRGALALPGRAVADIDRALERGRLTVRGYDRVLRIAWTEADLDGAVVPARDHVARALLLRSLQQVAA
jgi:magnesium chelatase family protein